MSCWLGLSQVTGQYKRESWGGRHPAISVWVFMYLHTIKSSYWRVVPAQRDLWDEDIFTTALESTLFMSTSLVCFLHTANRNPWESIPAAGGVLTTPSQVRGEAFTQRHSRDAHQLCPYKKIWFQQPAKWQISLLPATHALVEASPSHYFLDSLQESSSTSIIQLHKEQWQKHPCTQQSNPLPSKSRQEKNEFKMGGQGERRDSWSLAGKRVKTCCDNLGKQDVARSQMPTLFPHPDQRLSRLPSSWGLSLFLTSAKKIPKATLYWQI